MDIYSEIVRLFFMLIIMTPIIAIPFKVLSGMGWKLSILMALTSVIMFFISDSLRIHL